MWTNNKKQNWFIVYVKAGKQLYKHKQTRIKIHVTITICTIVYAIKLWENRISKKSKLL